MAITQVELGRRLRAAREACGLSQEQVALALGTSRPTVTQMEGGNRAVNSLELGQLAYLFGRDIRDFLGESFQESDALGALFRAKPEFANEPDQVEGVRKAVALRRSMADLQELLGMARNPPPLPSYNLVSPKGTYEAAQQGERVAAQERQRLGLGDSAVPDLLGLLDSAGVSAALVPMPDEVSGLALVDPTAGLMAVANRSHFELRRRFSLAHEYGHILMDRGKAASISIRSESSTLPEVRANSFAACFLMPGEGVREFVRSLGKGLGSRQSTQVFDGESVQKGAARSAPGSQEIQLYDVVLLAQHFGVSRSAAIFRLKNLQLLGDDEVASLRRQEESGHGKSIVRFLGLEDPDNAQSRFAFRQRFLGLALEAYRREAISKAKLSELAGMVDVERGSVDGLIQEAEEAVDPRPGLASTREEGREET